MRRGERHERVFGWAGLVSRLHRCWRPRCRPRRKSGPAAGYPNRFIKIIVPYSAGGGTDVVARVIGEKLGERLGQPVVIENKPGAGARLGTEFVATQPADGYTLLIAGGSEMAISPLIYKVNYDPPKSFIPLTIAIEMPLILLVPPNHPAKSAKELIAWAKSNPDKSNYATTAPGFTLPAELFKLRTGTPAVAITFKSANEGSVALMSGEASMAFFTPPGIVNQVKAGKTPRAGGDDLDALARPARRADAEGGRHRHRHHQLERLLLCRPARRSRSSTS